MEDALANLRLLDEEEEAIQEDEGAVNGAYQFCLVGRCLTDSVVHFPSLRNTMADLWHPIGGDLYYGVRGETYDTSILSLGIQKFLRIRVCLDVTAPLKRKNKVLIGKSMIVYARWLRATDGLPCVTENLVSFNHGISINERKNLGRNFRGIIGNQNSNPNLIPLGSIQYHSNNRQIEGRDGGNDVLVADGLVYGPMD
ncbi:hypothetical protein Goshw_010029 [Gossypium schwendimanii]|uniref:DUF4283 domain-containing protein n=1 Tax=Gossypium schwendimanii TaxID=34291 RepID=A0A7J9KKI8_GOSSC|nr:hypothetical protein [Gossypium schwendimanii]